jgi:hypothetical protein
MSARLRDLWSSLPATARLAVVAWVGVAAGVFGRVLFSPPRSQTVVPIYLAAGQKWRDAADVYEKAPGLDLYRNPPGVAAAFAALAPLPEKAAGVAWRGGCLAVFLLGLWRFRRDAVPELSADRAGWLFVLAAPLALAPLNNGQVNLLLAGAGLHGVAAAARGRWWLAAGWLALMGWVKVYPLAVGLLAVLIAPRRLGPKLLALTAAGFALPFVLADPGYVLEQYQSFAAHLAADDRTHTDLTRVPLDWTVLPRTWLGRVPGRDVATAVSLIAAAAAAGCVVRKRPSPPARGSLVLTLALGSVWMTAFGPATEMNTYSVLAGVAAYLAVAPGPRPRWAAAAAWAGYGLLAAAVVRCAFPADWRFQVLGPQAVGAVLLAAAAVAPASSGAGGIRTLDTVTRIRHFQCRLFNHSSTAPGRPPG